MISFGLIATLLLLLLISKPAFGSVSHAKTYVHKETTKYALSKALDSQNAIMIMLPTFA